MEPHKKEIRTTLKVSTVIVTALSIALILYTLINSETLQQEFSIEVHNYGIPSLFVFSLILDLVPQVISPVVILGAGVLAGVNTYFAIIITILGSTIGSVLGFILGKKYMYTAVDLLTSRNATKKLTYLTNKYGKVIVPLAAISPLPYLPVLLGAMNFSKKNFIVYGLIPRALSFIIFGYLIQTI